MGSGAAHWELPIRKAENPALYHPACPHRQVAYAGRVWTFPPTPDPALGPCGRVCAVREVNGTRWRWWGSVFSVKTAERAVASLQRLERQVGGQG
jgi:hypothetical protein